MGSRIDAPATAQAIETDVRERMAARGAPVSLLSLEASQTPEAAQIAQACARTGIVFNRSNVSSDSLAAQIDKANSDPAIHAILINGLAIRSDPDHWRDRIVPGKDAAGAGPMSAGRALTGKSPIQPVAAAWPVVAAEATGLDLWGARATVLGGGGALSRTLAMILVDKRATTTYVNVNHDARADLSEADVIFAAAGARKPVKPDGLKDGCAIVEIVPGDVDPAAFERAAHFLPAPEKSNPLAIALLLRNCLHLPR